MNTVRDMADCIQKIDRNFKLTMLEHHLRSAFLRLGFSGVISGGPFSMLFDPDPRPWEISCLLESLSKRMQRLDSPGSTGRKSNFG
jgi:hypothetical protein